VKGAPSRRKRKIGPAGGQRSSPDTSWSVEKRKKRETAGGSKGPP